ncbi:MULTISPECIES: hypothetical protein [unclassified Microcoleus]|uniref:hypothetical protein n=1 Tax=unclassified Microcoleus TaxID=2642155 RepID=UPI002FD24DA3
MQFRLLFTVSISHNYYSQGCKDFRFIIPPDSTQLLKNGKLIAKIAEDKLLVLFAADETENPLVLLTGKTLRIGLKLLNPLFSNFTDFDFDFNLSRPLYRNFTNSDTLDAAKTITLVGQVFSHLLRNSARPVTVILKNSDGQVLQTDTIAATNDRLTVSYDLTGQVEGAYSVEESYLGNIKTVSYYSGFELQQQGVFGIIEIAIASSFYTTPPNFAIAFTAKQQTLKYYVIAQNYSDADFNQLSVADAGEEGRSQINFTKVLPTAFKNDDISPSLLGNGDTKIALFKSQTAVTRQEKARKNIRLQKQKNGGVEELIKHLPQPGAEKATSDKIVQLSKPQP